VHPYGGGPGVGLYDRPYQLARAWQDLGHSPTVIIGANHHLLEKGFKPPPQFVVDGVRYAAVPCRPYVSNGIGRLLNMWEFSHRLRSFGEELAKQGRPDAIILSSPHPFPVFAGHTLARRYSAKLVFEIRDIWPLSALAITGMSKWHPFVQLCAIAERFALRKSHLIASVLPRADQYIAMRGYDKPFVWVPNGVGSDSRSEMTPLSPEARSAASLLDQWRDENRKIVVHAGTLGRHNAIDLLVEAIAFGHSIGEAADFRVLLLGVGEQMRSLQDAAKAAGLHHIHFAGRVLKQEVAGLVAAADIGYAGARPIDELYRFGVSFNKFADYYRSEIPIFLPLEPCGDPVSESGGGVARRAATGEDVWGAIRELGSLPRERRRQLGRLGREYMDRYYGYETIAANYVEAIERAPA
jgi:glycosyltransferase involved in cell wall biosynthesis